MYKGSIKVLDFTISGSICSGATCSTKPGRSLDFSTAYKWRVRPYTDGLWLTWSAYRNFSTAGNVPQPTSPSGVINGNYPTYTWTRTADTTKYQVQVFQGETKVLDIIRPSSVCSGSTCTTTPEMYHKDNTRHKWRARAYVNGAWRNWSAYKLFTVTPAVTRASVSSSNVQGNSWSERPSISSDGRFVAFLSGASNLVVGDTNGYQDVFVRDLQNKKTTCVSVSSSGVMANSYSQVPSISASGRFVAFWSVASNLVAGDTNKEGDIFVHDRNTGQTTRISVSSSGEQANNASSPHLAISGNGRFVAFQSIATNLVDEDTNNIGDMFVHDRNTGQTTRVSISTGGDQANNYSHSPSFSHDGRYVAFQSFASNLVNEDDNGKGDIFVHDQQTGETTRVSVASGGVQANGASSDPFISGDGRYVAFVSDATNLVDNDDNNKVDIFVHDRQNGTTMRVSVDSSNAEANGNSSDPTISYDRRHVVFVSYASNLVDGDPNQKQDVFLYNLWWGETTRVSYGVDDVQADNLSYQSAISADGIYVAFSSKASNLVDGDTNGKADIFVHEHSWFHEP